MIDADLLHLTEPNELLWSRVNFEEAMPGVLTPLTWTFWGWVTEQSSQRIYVERFGAFGRGELTDALADQTAALVHGRAAVNVDLLRRVLDRVPGADPDALELQVLGRVRPDARSHPTWRRVPAVLARAPWNVALLPRRVRALRRDVDAWWRASTSAEPPSLEACGRLLLAARDRFVDVAVEHGFNVFVGQAGYDQLAKLAAASGHPGLELALSASGDGTEETTMIDDLWAASQGRLDVDEVVARHGYHGPDEGQISSWSWREDDRPLRALLDRYRTMPARHASTTRAERIEAEARLLAGLSRIQRARARIALRFVDTYLPLREVGKAAFLQCIDVGRHAAHAAGRQLVADGRLAAVDDVAFLTVDELVAGDVDRARVELRRTRRAELLAVDLPDSFVGIPDVWPLGAEPAAVAEGDRVVRGIAASPGRHKGVARLVRSADDYARVEDGDVLVCELTDPGWTPLFAVVGAAVIDIGGPLSHGAIVAREVGIPCVIGTGDGTLRIADGTLVDVDGDRGGGRAVLTAADDGVHERPGDAPTTWQENCFLLARDDERDLCAYLHVERLHDRVEVKAAVDAAGRTTWHDADDDWWYEVDTPFERTRWRWRGGPVGIDLRLASHLPPVDHAAVLATLGLAGAERDHYEGVGRCTGTVVVDGEEVAFDGLFVRDHTWGRREYHQFGASWWWPTCFDDGDAYAGGVAVALDDRVVGYGLVADEEGVAAASEVHVEVDGRAEPGGYTGTTIRYEPDGRGPVVLRSTSVRHLCTTFPGFGPDRRWNEAYSACTWGDRVGFGPRELGC